MLIVISWIFLSASGMYSLIGKERHLVSNANPGRRIHVIAWGSTYPAASSITSGYLDLQGFKLFLKLAWEPFEQKFKPIEDQFLHHTLVVVRWANVRHLIKEYERKEQHDSREGGM